MMWCVMLMWTVRWREFVSTSSKSVQWHIHLGSKAVKWPKKKFVNCTVCTTLCVVMYSSDELWRTGHAQRTDDDTRIDRLDVSWTSVRQRVATFVVQYWCCTLHANTHETELRCSDAVTYIPSSVVAMTFQRIVVICGITPNSTWLDSTRHVRRVEPMHFGCVELVEQHSSTRSTRLARLARHVELDWLDTTSSTGAT